MNKHYNWKRFWCPRGGNISLTPEGFLYDLGAYNKDIVTFESITEFPCLVLLGEPGMGKSRTLKTEFDNIKTLLENDGDKTVWVDLRSFTSEDRLVSSIFGCNEFIEWLNSKHRLHLYLDSLDECLLRIDTVAALLVDELRRYPVERLSLRIACRSAEWPAVLENGIRELWGEESIKVYELAPLRRNDVIVAAQSAGIEVPELFLEEVAKKNAGPLAAKPVTLQLLLNLWLKNQNLPETQVELYERGCLLLCEEESSSRIAAKQNGKLTSTERMLVAARIACITIFANRFAIWKDIDRGNAPDEDVTIRDLCGNSEQTPDSTLIVTEETVREALEITGLFSLRGENRLGWAHQTFAEFLAAWYLKHINLNVPQVVSLITHAQDPDGKIPPQLHETSAWIAGMIPEVFAHLMKTDTKVLLRSDVASADASARSQLTAALLKLFAEEKERDHWEIRNQYHKLKHPEIADQLRQYIGDNSQGIIVRRAAIDIAEECQIVELQNELADIALNQNENLVVRIQAAAAICKIGDSDTKARFRPLALGLAGTDPDQELRGYGLTAVWPDHIAAEELFATLPHPKESFLGGYWRFLSSHLMSHFKSSDLPTALKWVEKCGNRHNLAYSFGQIVDEIVLMAWNNLEEPGVLEAFAQIALQRMKAYEEIIGDTYTNKRLNEFLVTDEKRYSVLKVLFSQIDNPDDDWGWFIDSNVISVSSKDVSWLLETLQRTDHPNEQLLLARLINSVLGNSELPVEILSALQAVCQIHPLLNSVLSSRFEVVDLASIEADKMRSYEEMIIKRQQRQALQEEDQRPLLEPSPAERIAQLLSKFENGDPDAWWRLNLEMTLDLHSTHYGNELEADITKLPGWANTDTQIRERIISAAKKYLLQGEPDTALWQGTNTVHRPAFAGYRALLLLLKEGADFIKGLAEAVWSKWVPIIVAYPTSSGVDTREEAVHRRITTLAYKKVPDALIRCLIFDLDNANQDVGYLRVSDKFADCWDAQMKHALSIKLQDQSLGSELFGNLLSQLLEHGDNQAQVHAESLLDSTLLLNEKSRKILIISARELLRHCTTASWKKVWWIIQNDSEIGREIIESLAYDPGNITARLTETAQSELYIWLAQQYPHREDPDMREAHFVGTRESVAEWRDSILRRLKERGTLESLSAIEKIQQDLPELDWIKWVLNEAKENVRRHTWVPMLPHELISLSQDNESLKAKSVQEKMPMKPDEQGEVKLLWNSNPINENLVLKEFLQLYKDNPDRVVPFVGAGLSVPLFPAWSNLLASMVRKCDEQRKLGYDSDELLRKIETGRDFLDIAECCVSALGETDYRDFIQANYDKDFLHEGIPLAYRELLSLNFRTILTTNYDRIPDVGGKGEYRIFTHEIAAEAQRARVEGKKVVMKLHGDVTNQSSIILTRSDYDQIIFRLPEIKNFLQGIFATKTILFIGFGLADPHLDHLLSGLKSICSGIPLTHYALLSGLTDFEANAKERNFGIKIIRYEPSDRTHPEVSEFVQLLASL